MDETIVYEGGSPRDATGRAAVASGSSAASADGPRTPAGRFTFASGSRPLDGYTIKRAIGRGGFSEVYYALTDAGKEVALKHITRNVDVERRGVIQCMNLKSPHLIAIHDLRSNDEGDTFVIMEYVAGPSLATVLERYPKGMPLSDVRMWLMGLVDGVTYLHEHGIVHRDLKPANLFLEEGVVKIGDYGLSKAMTGSKEPGHSQSVGTCHYMAPEIGTGKYNKPIDIYAMGVIIYELITGRVPFDGESVQEVLMKHLTSRPDLSPLPEPYRTIVGKALAKDPNLRPPRVVDLLPPSDAPARAEMRFIPENRTDAARGPGVAADAVAGRSAPAPPRPEPEGIRVQATEDPVFYIGPDTLPPRSAAQARRGGGWRGLLGSSPIAQAARNAARPVARPVSRPVPAARAVARRAAVVEPPRAPELPAPRIRVAELSTSMLLASVLAAAATVLSVPLLDAAGVARPNSHDPLQLGLLFSTILLGSWCVMVPAKMWEGHPVSAGSKRITYLLSGALLGTVMGFLLQYIGLEGPDAARSSGGVTVIRGAPSLPLMMAGFFGLTLAVPRMWKLAERGRKARFRVFPLLFVGLVALVAAEMTEGRPNGASMAVAMAAVAVTMVTGVVQLSSPWSRESAAYARYAEVMSRQRKRA